MKNIIYYNKKYTYSIFTKLIIHLSLNNIYIINKYMHAFNISILIKT